MTKIERDQGAGCGTLLRWWKHVVRSFSKVEFRNCLGARVESQKGGVALLDWSDTRPNSRPDCPVHGFQNQRERGEEEDEEQAGYGQDEYEDKSAR